MYIGGKKLRVDKTREPIFFPTYPSVFTEGRGLISFQ